MTIKLKENPSESKLKIDIFVPLNACACMYEPFINRVFSVIMEYMQYIDFTTKSLDSEEARALNLHENCVVLENNKIIIETYKLKDEIASLLRERGLWKK
jgi:hypothetical protein